MSARWTLTYLGTEKTVAEWGVSAAELALVSLAADTLALTFGGMPFDEDLPFAYNGLVTLKRYNDADVAATIFIGRVPTAPRDGQPLSESISITLQGLWNDLERTAFKQTWVTQGGAGSADVSRIIMGQSPTGTPLSIASGVAEVIAYAASCGTPLQLGTNIVEQAIPFSEVREQTCASMLRLYLAWQPSRVSYIDYNTTPATLHFIDRPTAPEIAFAIGTPPLSGVRITPRPDLQPPVVSITYLINAVVEGNNVTDPVVDRYPPEQPDNQLDAVVACFDLDGGSISTSTQVQKITTRNLPLGDWTDLAWWKKKLNWMNDAKVSDIVIEAGSEQFNYEWGDESSTFFYPREIVGGSFQEWMASLTSPAIHVVSGKVRARCTFKFTEPDTDAEVIRRCQIEASVVSTNASTGTYKKTVPPIPSAKPHPPDWPRPITSPSPRSSTMARSSSSKPRLVPSRSGPGTSST